MENIAPLATALGLGGAFALAAGTTRLPAPAILASGLLIAIALPWALRRFLPQAPLPLASYAVTLQRPLFTESRRPLPAAGVNAAAQAPAAPDELEKSQLLGLISGPSFVGIMARIDGQVRTVRRGDNIGPWTLRAIRDREVVFTQGDHERVLKLEYARGGADQAAAAAAERAAPPAPVAPAPTSARAPIAAPPPAPATAAVQPPAARPTSPAPAASPGAGPAWSLGARSAPRQPTASAPAR